jgi:isopropylmalate/homocitrate/citramalate synthase
LTTICEVGPRDGLQNEPRPLAAAVRVELVRRLVAAGLTRLEVVSFVSPEAVPQMADAEEVVRGLREGGAEYAGLVLNERGYDRLAAVGLPRVHFVVAATDSFSLRNANASVEDAMLRARRVIERSAADGRFVSVAISVAFGCPFEGDVDPGRVVELARRLYADGAGEVVLADTIGVAVPGEVRRLASDVAALGSPFGIHLHNTRNTGLANVHVALEAGAQTLDASVGGTGGCPFAPGATGNVATEDVVYMLEREGIDTGIDLDALIEVARWLADVLGRPLGSGVARAGPFPRAAAATALADDRGGST